MAGGTILMGLFQGQDEKGPLTLHLSLGSLVQSHKKLHDWNQLDLQPQPKHGVHNDVVGGRLENGEARCKTRTW